MKKNTKKNAKKNTNNNTKKNKNTNKKKTEEGGGVGDGEIQLWCLILPAQIFDAELC